MIRQSTDSLFVAYGQKGKAAALSSGSGSKQVALFNARAINRSGSAINVGICRQFPAAKTKLYTKVVSAYTLISSAALAAGQQVVNTTNNDGFVVASNKKFSLIGITVSNTATGGTYTFNYWNGSAWTALTPLENPTALGSLQDEYIAFLPPNDWVKGGPSGIGASDYAILIQHTTAPSDAGSINAVWLAEFLDFYEGVGDNNAVQLIFDSDRPLLMDIGESLHPYFSTANAANAFAAFYSLLG